MAEISSHNLPPYTSTDSADRINEAPPPYQAILLTNQPLLTNQTSQTNQPPPFTNQPPPDTNQPPPHTNQPPPFTDQPPSHTNQPPPFTNQPPPFAYHLPPPSYFHSSNCPPHQPRHESGLVFVDALHSNDNEQEGERENSSTVLLLYTLAVLTCVVCGFFAGLLFIVLILLGEKNSSVPMGKRRKYYLLLSLVVSVVSFFFAFVVISWFGYFMKPLPFGGCRFGVAANKTCCPMSIPPVMCQGVMRRASNGCRVCCTSIECQTEWRRMHCPYCKEYSTKADMKGCSQCCAEMKCGDRGLFRNAFNCTSCCPGFDSSSCRERDMRVVVDVGSSCVVCCRKCVHGQSTLRGRHGCPNCCLEPLCKDTYEDKDGCRKCCDPSTLNKCYTGSVAIDNHVCNQCCASDLEKNCAPNNNTIKI